MPEHPSQPALDVLGDQLEAAAGRAVAAGGTPPGGRRRSRMVLLPVLAVFAVVAIAAAVLVPGDGQSAEAAVRQAAQQTVDQSTGRFEVTVAGSGLAEFPDVGVTMSGAYDLPNERFETSLDLSGLAGVMDEGGMLGGEAFRVVVEGDAVYARIGAFGSMFGADTEWVRLPVPGDAGGDMFSGAQGAFGQPVDPGAFLEMLESFGGEVAELGREQLRDGVEATHYRGAVDLQQLFDEKRGEIEAELGAGVLPAEVTLPTMPTDVWIDDQGLVRRVEVRMPLDGLSASGAPQLTGEMHLTAEYFDVGAPVDIQVPAPEHVTDLEGVFGGLLEGFEGLDLEGLGGELDGLFGELEERWPGAGSGTTN